jgi:hypothetical protein
VPQDAPTIQAGIDSAGSGDDVLIAQGTYQEHDILLTKSIWLRSVAGAALTTISANGEGRVLVVRNVPDGCTIEGVTILRGLSESAYGGGILLEDCTATLRGCVILQCDAFYGGGIAAIEASVTVEACRFIDNHSGGGGAIGVEEENWSGRFLSISGTEFLGNSADSYGGLCCTAGGAIIANVTDLSIVNSVLARNVAGVWTDGAALLASSADGFVSGCTFVANESWFHADVPIVFLYAGSFAFERNIIAFNLGTPFVCWARNASLACSNVYGNSVGDSYCLDDAGGNFSADPLFCDVAGGNYNLINTSPCLPGQHPDGAACGLIGAFGTGCESTPVERTSWGRIKGLYRP